MSLGERNYSRLVGPNGPLVRIVNIIITVVININIEINVNIIITVIFITNQQSFSTKAFPPDGKSTFLSLHQVYPAGHAWLHLGLHQLTEGGLNTQV